jgi:hypothetical protein
MSAETDVADEAFPSSPELDAARAKAVAIHGERVAVYELGGRFWCVAVPARTFRAQWQRYKAAQISPDPTTKADAGVQLARAMLVPHDAPATTDAVKAERAAFDAMGEEFPALLDVLASGAEALGFGPLPMRGARPPSSSGPGDATPTSPPTP